MTIKYKNTSLLLKGGLFSFLFFFLIACQSGKTTDDSEITFTDFLNNQIAQLNASKPTVIKKGEIDGKSDTKKLKNLNWRNEFEMFFQADILKSSFAGRYNIEQNNSHERIYAILPHESIPVKYLKINFGNDTTEISRIIAVIDQSNYLYKTEKHLEMNFRKKDGKMFLKDYSITGKRKLIITREINFSVKSDIVE